MQLMGLQYIQGIEKADNFVPIILKKMNLPLMNIYKLSLILLFHLVWSVLDSYEWRSDFTEKWNIIVLFF